MSLVKLEGDGLFSKLIAMQPTALKDLVTKERPDLSEDAQKKVADTMYESMAWRKIADTPTPLSAINIREFDDIEYIDEFYIKECLDRFFPGWWQEDMETKYVPEIKTWYTTGYGLIEYILPSGATKLRKIYAVGACEVQGKKEDKTLPSQPDDMAKGSLTEWIKIFGKRLGFGLDIYSQDITPALRKEFELCLQHLPDRITWTDPKTQVPGEATPKATKVTLASKIETGKGFRRFLSEMPNADQMERFVTLIKRKIPESAHGLFWNKFLELKNNSLNNANTLESWLLKIAERSDLPKSK